jgi:hypothetical protein
MTMWKLGREVGTDDTDAECAHCGEPYRYHRDEVCPTAAEAEDREQSEWELQQEARNVQ